MIIIPPDNKSQDTAVPRREELPAESLPGPPPSGQPRKTVKHVRRRRIVACVAILLSVAFIIIQTARHTGQSHPFRPRKKIFAFDKHREPEVQFNPQKLVEIEKTFL